MALFETQIQYPALFEKLWAIYPLKVAKRDACRAWRRLHVTTETDQAIIVAAIERAKKTPKWRQGIIPHLATYLNGRRWEDELGPQISEAHKEYKLDPRIDEAFRKRWEEERKKPLH